MVYEDQKVKGKLRVDEEREEGGGILTMVVRHYAPATKSGT